MVDIAVAECVLARVVLLTAITLSVIAYRMQSSFMLLVPPLSCCFVIRRRYQMNTARKHTFTSEELDRLDKGIVAVCAACEVYAPSSFLKWAFHQLRHTADQVTRASGTPHYSAAPRLQMHYIYICAPALNVFFMFICMSTTSTDSPTGNARNVLVFGSGKVMLVLL
jgi:hypothetical protein